MIALLLGGARSGKSRRALELTAEIPQHGYFIATAEKVDDEMSARILKHQVERSEKWQTIETPLALTETLASLDHAGTTIVVDCLTVWLANLLHYDKEVQGAIDDLVTFLPKAKADIRLVSNETGLGLVPETAMGREFRDIQGRLNQEVAAAADLVEMLVAGIPLVIKS